MCVAAGSTEKAAAPPARAAQRGTRAAGVKRRRMAVALMDPPDQLVIA
jgi:hypothetical protein